MSALLSSEIVRIVLLGAALLGMIGGLLGAFAVLRRQSLLGDALAHATLPGLCLGFLVMGERSLIVVLGGALATGAMAALSVHLIVTWTRLKSDAALGIVLSCFFALGIVLLTVIQGRGGAGALGLQSFLFGQAAAIQPGDLWLLGAVAAGSLVVTLAFWKEFKLITFDPAQARVQGLPVGLLQGLLTLMFAVAIVVGLQLVGVVLMVAIMIAPAVAARQWTQALGPMVALSAALGALSGAAGALVSATARGLATGPVVVLLATAGVILSLLLAPRRGLIWQGMAARRARAQISEARVLATLGQFAADHADARYPAEAGMLGAALGAAPSPDRLEALRARGLIRAVMHPPETTPHWELTARGHAEAEALRRRQECARSSDRSPR